MTAILLFALISCGGEPETGTDATVVRDSAGVRVVETAVPAWEEGAGWTISPEPLLRIGVDDGAPEYLLSRVVGAIRLDDGTVLVGDGTSNQVRFYDDEGRFLRSVGREGQGPGEFEYMRDLQRCGSDRFYAFDINWQAKVYTFDGELLREFGITEPGSERSPYFLSCALDGSFVITGWGERAFAPQIGFYSSHAPVWILDPEGREAAELGEFLASERIGSEFGSRPHPFGRSTVVAHGGDRVYVGPSERLEILTFTLSGAPESVLRGPTPDLTIRPEHLNAYRDQLLEERGTDRRQEVEREVRELPLPDALPAYDRIQTDPEGNLWVRRVPPPGMGEAAWVVFDPEGVVLGSVSAPPGLEITEIGEDYVLGIHRDGFGVERVQLHLLEREG